jgi:hypothetical protein
VIVHRAMLDVPRELSQYLGRLLAAERRRPGARKGTRALTCIWRAVLGVRWFRDNAEPSALARDHRISRATAYRYLDEVVAVLDGKVRTAVTPAGHPTRGNASLCSAWRQ